MRELVLALYVVAAIVVAVAGAASWYRYRHRVVDLLQAILDELRAQHRDQ